MDRFRNGLSPALLHAPMIVTNALHPMFQNSSTRRFLILIRGAAVSPSPVIADVIDGTLFRAIAIGVDCEQAQESQ